VIKAVIFDMDGVLVDSEPIHYKANVLSLKEFGFELTLEDYKKYGVAKGTRNLYISLNQKYDLKLDYDKVHPVKIKYITNELIKAKLRDGVKEFLESLSNFKLGLASASSMPVIKVILDAFKLEKYFDEIHSGEEVTHNKPSPEIYLETAKKLGVDPIECVVIEDSDKGVQAGIAAGMKVIAFPNEFTKDMDLSQAILRVNSLSEINMEEFN